MRTMPAFLLILSASLIGSATAQGTHPLPSPDRLMLVSARKISATNAMLDIKLRSGDLIKVPPQDVHERATEIVRAALRSQSPALRLPSAENLVILRVTGVTAPDNDGRLTVTLASGVSVRCRVEDLRDDRQLTFLRTVLTAEISKETAAKMMPAAMQSAPQTAIQFDSKGADFSAWVKSFVAQVRTNWFVPYAEMSRHGHVAVTFFVHRDGTITDARVLTSSGLEAFDKSALYAVTGSNPTAALPPEYPEPRAFLTVTFYFNEFESRHPDQ